MKPIIKETLQKKTTTSAKLRYLAYAYKEWLIAITLFVVFAGSITYSLTRPQEEVVNAAIVIETAMDPAVQSELEAAVEAWAIDQGYQKEELRISLVSYAEPAAVQAFTTRLAAGAIQMVVFPASEAQTWQERFGSQELAREIITVGENEFILQVTNKEK
ncbi:hypothetical protein IGJ01_003096 [Enterococcus sp. AZ089]|uniref:hypothetical protein n=1 Tax=unclassified Enterococcus TaxID=2608891 RepID=UPI001FD3BD0A|nr:hypothetical protein LLW22_15700 [Enterococcus casseliflavus]